MWSDIFLHENSNGQKIAIMLLDTQGAFDNQSTLRESSTIFALSTLLSSVQIFNLSQNIQGDDLQHLQSFTEYGRLALTDSGKTPFQRLQFLIRDWGYADEEPYGQLGGESLLKKRLEISYNQPKELQSIRRDIHNSFSKIACFLMPHPGLNVMRIQYDGRFSDLEHDFKENLQEFVPMLFAAKNLVIKEVNGQKVRARNLLQYFKAYINIFKEKELPLPKNVLAVSKRNI